MPKRIRIGDIGLTTTEATIYNGFNDYGTITQHWIERDALGQSLGVAHVVYTASTAGTAAIAARHNTMFDGSLIAVTNEDPPQ